MQRNLGEGSAEIFDKAGVNVRSRPQDLSISQWCSLANRYEEWLKQHPEHLIKFEQKMQLKKDSPDMYAMAQRILADFENKTL